MASRLVHSSPDRAVLVESWLEKLCWTGHFTLTGERNAGGILAMD